MSKFFTILGFEKSDIAGEISEENPNIIGVP